MTRDEFIDLAAKATLWLDTLGRGDAAGLSYWIIDLVVDHLRADAGVPPHAFEAWQLIFADLRQAIEDQVTELIAGHSDLDAAIEAIADRLDDEAQASGRTREAEPAEAAP
jgi:hypothetical protein